MKYFKKIFIIIIIQYGKGDKHKFERFLQNGRTSVATIYGPIAVPPAPVLLFKDNGPNTVPTLVATGSLLEVHPRRIIVKRIVLTGEPFKIHRKTATIRFMFFNPEDVRWFKPIEV